MKTMQKLLYSTTMALAVCIAGTNLRAQTNDCDGQISTNTQQGEAIMTDQNNNPKDDTLWEKTKETTAKAGDAVAETSGDAWEATKEGSAKAWDKTKEVSGNAWEATKEGSAKAWDKTKEVSGKAWEATKEGAAKAKDAVTD